MASTLLGKRFEAQVLKNWKECFPGDLIWRIPDQQSQYHGSRNFSDFLAFTSKLNLLWMLECKETKLGTINFSKMSQIDVMKDFIKYNRVMGYFIIWFSELDKIVAISCQEALRLRDELKLKSINIKMLQDKSIKLIEIPTTKKRVFLDGDYTYLTNKIFEEVNNHDTRKI